MYLRIYYIKTEVGKPWRRLYKFYAALKKHTKSFNLFMRYARNIREYIPSTQPAFSRGKPRTVQAFITKQERHEQYIEKEKQERRQHGRRMEDIRIAGQEYEHLRKKPTE
jgi:hypothetical protein